MKALAIAFLVALLPACTGGSGSGSPTPGPITLGVLPDQSRASVIAKYSPLVDYLSRATALEFELVVSTDYASMLDDFHDRRVDIVNFGGLTFTEAERRYNAEPLVMRDTDLNFASCYLVRGTDNRRSVKEFEGEVLAFGPELSTSGHLMPRYFLKSAGLDPDTFFASTRHSSGHDETATWVRDGDVPIGVANCFIVDWMNADGRLQQGDIRVMETTPAYADYVWAVQYDMDSSLKIRIRDAFMALDPVNPEHQVILGNLDAAAYLPAGSTDFDDVRRAARDVAVAALLGLE